VTEGSRELDATEGRRELDETAEGIGSQSVLNKWY
jgi:hypothetical protein